MNKKFNSNDYVGMIFSLVSMVIFFYMASSNAVKDYSQERYLIGLLLMMVNALMGQLMYTKGDLQRLQDYVKSKY